MLDNFRETRDEIDACATCFDYPNCIWLKLCEESPNCYQEEREHKFNKLRQSILRAFNKFKDNQDEKQEDEIQDEEQN